MKCLVVAAHPDDEVYGAGGTMARFAAMGAEVYVSIITEGCSAQYPGREDMKSRKREEALRANRILGVKEVMFFDLPDMKLDTVAHLEINRCIEECVNRIKPDIVFTHHYGDVNKDHRLVHESTMVAARPVAGSPVKRVYAYEVPSSTEWAAGNINIFVPSVFINIGSTLEQKLSAVRAYDSELRPYPHPRSEAAVRAYHQRRGLSVGLEFAEAFCLMREIQG